MQWHPCLIANNRTRRGSVFIEVSLIFVTAFALLLAALDFGQFLFIHSALLERARSAARWGAIHNPADSVSIQNMVLYNQSTSPGERAETYFNLTRSMVQVSEQGLGTDDHRLVVKISGYTYKVYSLFIGGTFTGPPLTIAAPLGDDL